MWCLFLLVTANGIKSSQDFLAKIKTVYQLEQKATTMTKRLYLHYKN